MAATPHFPTRAAFTGHLRALPPRRIVGVRMHGCKCPIAEFARLHGYPEACVTGNYWQPSPRVECRLPWWARELRRAIDNGGVRGSRVTAGRVLRLLEAIEV